MNATRTYTAYDLARMAGCASPDSNESAGAQFLYSILSSWEGDGRERVRDGEDLADVAHEIADSAPDVYTYQRWLEFVDLAAWQEDLDDLGGLGSMEDLTQAAGVALYIIAERLVYALAEDTAEDEPDAE